MLFPIATYTKHLRVSTRRQTVFSWISHDNNSLKNLTSYFPLALIMLVHGKDSRHISPCHEPLLFLRPLFHIPMY
jgi:hypothetical protein